MSPVCFCVVCAAIGGSMSQGQICESVFVCSSLGCELSHSELCVYSCIGGALSHSDHVCVCVCLCVCVCVPV